MLATMSGITSQDTAIDAFWESLDDGAKKIVVQDALEDEEVRQAAGSNGCDIDSIDRAKGKEPTGGSADGGDGGSPASGGNGAASDVSPRQLVAALGGFVKWLGRAHATRRKFIRKSIEAAEAVAREDVLEDQYKDKAHDDVPQEKAKKGPASVDTSASGGVELESRGLDDSAAASGISNDSERGQHPGVQQGPTGADQPLNGQPKSIASSADNHDSGT